MNLFAVLTVPTIEIHIRFAGDHNIREIQIRSEFESQKRQLKQKVNKIWRILTEYGIGRQSTEWHYKFKTFKLFGRLLLTNSEVNPEK